MNCDKNWTINHYDLYDMLHANQYVVAHEDEVYFTHTDHLGSACWITDKKGDPIQYIHYAPYGELMANQQAQGYSYDERFKFTGKERDGESGYDYYGARYYTHLLGIWMSVDPLSDKYPHVTPYFFCNGNPIMLVDPDGRDGKKVINNIDQYVEISVSFSVGAQVAVDVDNVGVSVNFGSYQVDREHSMENSTITQGTSIGIGIISLSTTIETIPETDEGKAIQTKNSSIGVGAVSIDLSSTAKYAISDAKNTKLKETKNVDVSLQSPIKAKLALLVGMELKLSVHVLQFFNDLLD